jgi:RNA polymerase sigma-70 factor (ECF subfamily)
MDERETVRASQSGDRTAFGRLIDLHYKGLYRFACQSTGSPGDADDICQETFLQALRQIHRLRDSECFRPWLYKIALNLMRRRSRFRRMDPASAQTSHRNAPGALETLKGRERADLVRGEIGRLPEPLHLATILVVMDGMTQKEAAGIIGCSEATVSRHLDAAREVLRVRLGHLTD